MIQSINANSTIVGQNTQATASALSGTRFITPQAADTTKTTDDENGTNSVSKDGDSVTISSQSLKVFSQISANSVTNSETGTAAEGTTTSNASAIASAAASAGITDTTALKSELNASSAAISGGSSASGSSSSTNSSQLSQYSESELKEMLQNGEISTAEYEAEIKSRTQSESSSDDNADNTQNVSTDATEE